MFLPFQGKEEKTFKQLMREHEQKKKKYQHFNVRLRTSAHHLTASRKSKKPSH